MSFVENLAYGWERKVLCRDHTFLGFGLLISFYLHKIRFAQTI